ncbi:hypothetical protein C3L33_08934, partial [Rhododendron williamsianum]
MHRFRRRHLLTRFQEYNLQRSWYNEFVPQRTSAYISQHDLHLGELTVRETLAFSARCQGVGQRYEMLTELSRREKEANIMPDPDIDIFMKAASLEGGRANVITDYIIKILGLDVCADSLVGDEMLRGISGGQNKRVTTGKSIQHIETLIESAILDEISTGLDSSTTFQIVNSIKNSSHILRGTCVISLLQPAPETYDLFDDIILLSAVKLCTKAHVRMCSSSLTTWARFRCPERKGVADFLQEVISSVFSKTFDAVDHWARRDEPYSFVTAREFAESLKSFHVGRELDNELSIPFDKAKSHPAALSTRKYGVSKKELLKSVISREYLLMKRNSFLTIMAFIVMTIFLRTKMSKETTKDGGIFMGALFFTLLLTMFNGMAELALTIMKLPTFYKQRNLLFFPSWAFSLPAWILKMPITFIEVGILVFTTYYVIGFDPNVGRLFKMYLLLLCVNQMASGLFRLIAALGRNMIVANTFGSFALLTIVVLGGFILSRDNIKKWWIWGYWVSPLMYGQNAIAVNEFLGHSWKQVPANSMESLGVLVLKSRGLFPKENWYWIGVGALIGYVFLFNGLYTLALAYLSPFERPQAVLSEEIVAERNSVKAGKVIELSSRGKGSSERGDEVQRSLSSKSRSSRIGSISEDNKNRQRGMVLPFEPLSIAFDDIKYSVDMPQVSSFYVQLRDAQQNYIVYESLTYSVWLRLPSEVDSAKRKMFVDELFLLKRGGEEIYVGPLGHHSAHLISYFEGINGVSKVKDGYNPATWMLEVTSIAQEAAHGIGSKRGTQQDLFNAMGSMYSAVLFVGVQNATSVQPVVAVERTIFYREKAAGMYSALPYAFGQVVIELPYIFVLSVIYGVIVYSMIGFEWTAAKFFWYLFFMYFTLLYFTFYGMMTVAVTPNHSMAAIVASAFYAIWNLFSGFIIPKTRLPVWWKWYVYICPVSWTLYGLVASQFGNIQAKLDTGETVEYFVQTYFDFKHDFVGYVAIIIVGNQVLCNDHIM